jgi:hypothetical protein
LPFFGRKVVSLVKWYIGLLAIKYDFVAPFFFGCIHERAKELGTQLLASVCCIYHKVLDMANTPKIVDDFPLYEQGAGTNHPPTACVLDHPLLMHVIARVQVMQIIYKITSVMWGRTTCQLP